MWRKSDIVVGGQTNPVMVDSLAKMLSRIRVAEARGVLSEF